MSNSFQINLQRTWIETAAQHRWLNTNSCHKNNPMTHQQRQKSKEHQFCSQIKNQINPKTTNKIKHSSHPSPSLIFSNAASNDFLFVLSNHWNNKSISQSKWIKNEIPNRIGPDHTFLIRFNVPWKKNPSETMIVTTVANDHVGVTAKDRPSSPISTAQPDRSLHHLKITISTEWIALISATKWWAII